MKIGSISIPHISVADDLALLALYKSDMQVIVWDAENEADRERYCIHPTKIHTIFYNFGRNSDSELNIFLSEDRVDITDSLLTVHLGIQRNTSGKADIEGKITLGRKTAYSLMARASMGAQNGHIWSVLVIPRLLYGLEFSYLRKRILKI